jgi:hypothetical protein
MPLRRGISLKSATRGCHWVSSYCKGFASPLTVLFIGESMLYSRYERPQSNNSD